MIVDTHQHLWELDRFRLPWLEGETDVLCRSYTPEDYASSIDGLGPWSSVYMEVDVDPSQQAEEVDYVAGLCTQADCPTVAGVVSAYPLADRFAETLAALAQRNCVKGIRQVLHGDATPAGYCLQDSFIEGIRKLGEQGLSFDVCIGPRELADATELARRCPQTTIIIDHCGNADPKAFDGRGNDDEEPWHDADAWKRDMEALAGLKNTICKISGIVVRTRAGGWSAADLTPIVNHCLAAFGPERVIFGSDWPVCRLKSELADWVAALREIVSDRPEPEQQKLWHENARRIYGLT